MKGEKATSRQETLERMITRRDFLKVAGTGFAGAALIGVAGCGQSVSGNNESGGTQPSAEYLVSKKEGPYLVGFSNAFVSNSWRTQGVAALKYAAQERKDQIKDIIVTDANNDVATQNSQIGNLVSRGVDILLVDATSETALDSAINRAHDQGILVVSFDNTVTSKKAIAVNASQEKFGEIGGKWLADQMGGKGKVFALNGVSGSPTDNQRWGAAKKVLEEAGIEIVGQVNADWDQAKGRTATADLLSAHPDVTGIYSQGGAMTLGALQALEAANHDLVPIPGEGYNGLLKKWQQLQQSQGWSSIAPAYPPSVSVDALEVALKAIRGEDVGRNVQIDLPVITQDNLDKYVRPDFPDSLWLPTTLPKEQLNKLFS